MINEGDQQTPVTWSDLPLARINHLIPLLAQLVQRQMTKTFNAKEVADECPIVEPAAGTVRKERKNRSPPSGQAGGNLCSSIHPAASGATPGIDPPAIRSGRVGRATGLATAEDVGDR